MICFVCHRVPDEKSRGAVCYTIGSPESHRVIILYDFLNSPTADFFGGIFVSSTGKEERCFES